MTDTHPLEQSVRDYLHRRVNEGNSYVKTFQIAKALDVDSHDIVPVVKGLREDGTLEVWSDSTNTPAVYRIANSGDAAASSPANAAADGGGKARCLAATNRDVPCKNPVLEPFDRCTTHIDLAEIGTDQDDDVEEPPVWERHREQALGGGA